MYDIDNFKKYYDIVMKYQYQYDVKIISLVKECNVRVFEKDLSSYISGAIVNKNNEYHIYINKNYLKEDKRFIIAREFSHYLLHKDLIKDILAHNDRYMGAISKTYENRASCLALEILIPIKPLRVMLFENNIRNYNVLANTFNVSYDMIYQRIKNGGNLFIED